MAGASVLERAERPTGAPKASKVLKAFKGINAPEAPVAPEDIAAPEGSGIKKDTQEQGWAIPIIYNIGITENDQSSAKIQPIGRFGEI